MQLINEVLHEHLFKGILVYLDNILIYIGIMDKHVQLVKAVLEKFLAAQLYMKLSKCEFHQVKLHCLEYQISHKRVDMDPENVQAVIDWEAPST